MTNLPAGSSTRREILQLIRLGGGLTAQQLATELHITSMGVRRTLLALERDGLVKVQTQRQTAGRPTYIYQLTAAGYDTFPNNYHLLATQLLDALQTQAGGPQVDALFAARMDQLVAQYAPRFRGKDLGERVAELAKVQDESGYMAVWEKTAGGYVLKEQNCAIYRVACRFQAACHFELELFRRLLQANITRRQHQIKGDLACVYFISERPRRASSRQVTSRLMRKVKTPGAK